MISKRLFLYNLIILFYFSCGKDEDASDNPVDFYNGADTSVTTNEIIGTWAIFNLAFEDQIFEVNPTYEECDRNFVVFSENNNYAEYLVQNTGCDFITNMFDWELNNGIITLINQFNQTDDLVITSASETELIFKTRLDIDNDNEIEIVTVYMQTYQPTDIDVVSPTFRSISDTESVIDFSWQPYFGFSEFDRYEIYRSQSGICSKENAILLETFYDVDTTTFEDLSPPVESILCYYIKTYTSEGLLGESFLQSVVTENLVVAPVNLDLPIINGNSFSLSWEMSESMYFSHYEIEYSNYGFGNSGVGLQNVSLATIENQDITSYDVVNPPLLENPFFNIFVYDIFGNKTQRFYSDVQVSREVEFKPQSVISLESITSYAVDNENEVVYFFGKASGDSALNIFKYNYSTLEMEAVSNLSINIFTNVPIRLTNSGNGKEIIYKYGSNLRVYDANTLSFKYTLDTQISSFEDFAITENDIWILVSSDNIYSYKRDNANFMQLDSKPHLLDDGINNLNNTVFEINGSRMIVGNPNESNSIVFNLDSNGNLDDGDSVAIPITNNYFSARSEYSNAQNYIANFDENRLYSTTTFSLLESFETPYFPTGISIDGNFIFGSNNNPEWQITPESIHAKEAKLFNRATNQVQTINTTGYPHLIFENSNGNFISISSWLKKDNLRQNINDRSDLFIEQISFD